MLLAAASCSTVRPHTKASRYRLSPVTTTCVPLQPDPPGSPALVGGVGPPWLGMFNCWPGESTFGLMFGFAAISAATDTPQLRAILYIQSPVCTVYGLGQGAPDGTLVAVASATGWVGKGAMGVSP